MVRQEKDKSLELSAERSKLALQRTMLANNRTFAAWIRTGLAIVLAGLAIVGFIGEVDSFTEFVVFLGILIGLIFVLLGIIIYIFAYITYKENLEEMNISEEDEVIPLRFLFAVTSGLVLISFLIALLILFL